jgi:hypothetical protein
MLLNDAIKSLDKSHNLQLEVACEDQETPSGRIRVTHSIVRRQRPLP